MNWKWLRCFICRAASLALLVALAGQALAPAAWAQDGAAGKSPADASRPRKRIPPIQTQETAPYIITSQRSIT